MGAGEMLNFWTLVLLILPGVLGGDWAVNYPETPVCAARGSAVVIPCTFEHPEGHKVTEKMWCHDDQYCAEMPYVLHSGNKNVNSEYRGRAEFFGGGEKNCSLRIKNIRHTDAGVYKFRFITDKDRWTSESGVTLKVAELRVTTRSTLGNEAEQKGETVNLTCSADGCSPSQTTFTWFKDKQRLPQTHSALHLSPVSVSDSGQYSCALAGQEDTLSVDLRLNVEEFLGGRWAVNYPETPVCAARGSTVVIPCSYEHPEGHQVNEKMWCHNDVDCKGTTYVHHSGNISISPGYRGRAEFLGGGEKNCTLRIKNISHTDAGVYTFRFITDNKKWWSEPGVALKVKELKVVMISYPGNGTVREGDSVNLTCSSEGCSPNQTKFIWFKDKQRLPETQSTLHLSPVSVSDSGNYSCALEGHEGAASVDLRLDVEASPEGVYVEVPDNTALFTGLLVLLVVTAVLLAVVPTVIICVKRKLAANSRLSDASAPFHLRKKSNLLTKGTDQQEGNQRSHENSVRYADAFPEDRSTSSFYDNFAEVKSEDIYANTDSPIYGNV